MGRVSIVIIDDHPLFRAGVAQSLRETGDLVVIGEGSSADDAIRLSSELDPDILLLDISIPGVLVSGGGIEALAAILGHDPHRKVVMLTVSEAAGDVTRAMRIGAHGYVLKGIEAESLLTAIRSVAAGERYVSPNLSARLLSVGNREQTSAASLHGLDERQRRILDLVSAGLSNKEIANELSLQEKTIKHQLTRIFALLAVSNRTEAAMAFRDARSGDNASRGHAQELL